MLGFILFWVEIRFIIIRLQQLLYGFCDKEKEYGFQSFVVLANKCSAIALF